MEMAKEPERERELGGHDGDDGDDDDRLGILLAHLTASGQFLATCTSARLHGISFEAIRAAFDAQLALVITTENSISSGDSKREAMEKVKNTADTLTRTAYQFEDDEKDRS